MRRMAWTVVLGLSLAMASTSSGEMPQFTRSGGDVLYGGLVGASKAARDTTYLLGGPGRLDGKFQDQYGNPDWQGWTHLDATSVGVQRWNVSDFNVPAGGGTLAMWCGQHGFVDPCGSGYGNGWNENLVFTYTVANPAVNTVLGLECIFNYDTEEGCDYFRIQQNRGGTWEDVISYTGLGTGSFDDDITYTPSDYVGPSANLVEVRFLGVSDSVWSDEDCHYDSNGLAQVDNIRVTIGASEWYEDHEDGDNGSWVQVFNPGVGDFAKIWSGLQDIDPCRSNLSPQVAFIDDGIVVPGTGGTPCLTWCYGPGGFIVNNSGGLAGPDRHLENAILSPILTWPAGDEGGILTFDVYQHEDLEAWSSPGMFWQWHVRSTASVDPADLEAATWKNRNWMEHGRNYVNTVENVTDLLVPGRRYAQVRLQVIEFGWIWGWEGADGTPAPYFDNVAFKVFPSGGPSVAARVIDLAQDNFPERGELDLVNLANNWVRFDMARNVSPDADAFNNPGDSILVDIGLPRAGSVLNDLPKLVVKMKANPLFDAVRVLPAGFTQTGDIIDGWVYGDSTRHPDGWVVANRYDFDLPDSNFLFPGDVIHYYIEAKDDLNGDVGTTTLPADLDHLPQFHYADLYPEAFTVRALPSVKEGGFPPAVLFWNDAAGGGEDTWYDALRRCNYVEPGEYFDIYETNGPSSGVGNGLGGRATDVLLSGYRVLIYTCGDLGVFTLGNGDTSTDPSDDLAVLAAWFAQGDKHAFMTGDDLVESLGSGAASVFRQNYLGVDLVSGNIMPLIGNQVAPRLQAVAGNTIDLPAAAAWIAGGGCPGIKDFDAVTPRAGAETVARFCNPSGQPDYPYAGMWRYTDIGDVVACPYDLLAVANAPDWTPPGPTQARAFLLRMVLLGFNQIPPPDDAVPDGSVLAVSAHPNPFNPRTTITLVMPRAGDAALKLYDIRGRLVRTLHDGRLAEGRHELTWNGDDDAGRAMASGVYFYEAKAAGEVSIGKLALVR